MGIRVLNNALAYRAVQWGRVKNKNYDVAVFVNDHIGSSIITNGIYEKDFLELTRCFLTEINNNYQFKDGLCLDVGANIGNHSIFYSTLFKRVIAFEPNPIAYKLFEATILKNRIKNIDLFTVALGAKREEKILSIIDDNLGMSTIVAKAKNTSSKFYLEIKVEVGDDLLKDHIDDDEFISLIKIDIEGYEAEALLGLRSIIKKHNPVIAIELNFFSTKDAAESALKTLMEFGYTNFYVIESSKLIQNRLINFFYRLFFTDKKVFRRIYSFDNVNYQQLFCVKPKV